MPMAVFQNGQIHPIEPLPAEWQEGQRLRVETIDDDEIAPEQIDRDFALLDTLCADSDPVDDERLRQALDEARRLSKEQVRKQMGLS